MTIGYEADVRDCEEWLPTPQGVRDVILAHLVVGLRINEGGMPSEHEVETISEMSREAILAGRFIDFGFWPNAVMKHCGQRGGPLYNQRALPMPFNAPWLFMHEWQADADDPEFDGIPHHRASCVYLINPVEGLVCEAVQLDPMKNRGVAMLSISDRAVLLEPTVDMPGRYHVDVYPSPWRVLATGKGVESMRAAAANVCDPLMAALMMLNTRGVPRETVEPSVKLNKARARGGKLPFPPYERVMSSDYVTAITARREGTRGESLGGHHASPIAHIRRGHFRQYESGKRSFIHDTLVNVSEEARAAFVSTRTHYEVKG